MTRAEHVSDTNPPEGTQQLGDEETIGRYRVIRQIGSGGMGEVFLAEDPQLERSVAIKRLPVELTEDSERCSRLLAEARAASALNHPNVCVIHEVGETDKGHPFLVMELLEGRPLGELAAEGALEIVRIVEIAMQIADALDAAHSKGIIHRDIKPANISVNARGQVKVLDFGLAKRLKEDADPHGQTVSIQTQAGTVMGTPGYMSPEQALGRAADHRSDIFSLGVVLYELLTARSPFAGASLGETIDNILHLQPPAVARFNYSVPEELERITLKCLQKSPDVRYQSARELLIDLKSILSESPVNQTDIFQARPDQARDVSRVPKSASAVLKPPPATEVRNSDIFISCSDIDNKPLWPETEGWISQFRRNLQTRLEQLLGEPVNVLSYPMPAGSALEDTLVQALPSAKTLVSVVSPPFAKSQNCTRAVEEFWRSEDQSGRLWVGDRSRLFKVVKTPVNQSDVPPGLAEPFSRLISFDFFEEDPATGRVREFDERFGPEARQRYFERVYDIAQEIHGVLTAMKQNGSDDAAEPGKQSQKVIYLAASTSDLQTEVDKIRRELVARGHQVLPDRPLPLVGDELEAVVRQHLERSQLVIHPIGGVYGVIPEGSDHSLIELQSRIAAEHTAHSPVPRVIWLPRELVARDAKQEAFLQSLREDVGLNRGADIVQNNLESLKSLILDKLTPPKPVNVPAEETGSTGTPRVYLICDKQDEGAVEPLEDYLFGQGFEVSLPDFEADEAEAAEVHRQNLLDCDAVLVYYGSVRHSWVDIKLRSILKASGYGRTTALLSQAVCVAPPHDRRKERFRSHTAEVIRQETPTDLNALQGFVRQVAESAKGQA